jgi:hypothetical protein
MPDDLIKVGYHDKGFWDASNNVSANKKPIANNLNINDAIAKAKSNSGAELILVDESGNAKVHSLQISDSLIKDNKTIDNKELFRSPKGLKQDMAKMPLVINDNISKAFNSSAAFLVDEKNNVTYLGEDVEKTTSETTLKDAEKFVSTPNKNKVDTAYTMAKEAGNEKRVEVKLAQNVLNDLSKNYKNSSPADSAVALLKPSDTKTKMEKLLVEIKSIDKLNNNETNELKAGLAIRTGKWEAEIAKPQQRLDKANKEWNTADTQESDKVRSTARNLREAKMPGIHRVEDNLSGAMYQRDIAKNNLDTAISQRISAKNNLDEVEDLPDQANRLKSRNSELQRENRNLTSSLISYLSITQSQVSSEARNKRSDLRSTEMELSSERSRPSGPSVTDDPFSNKKSVTDDPFSNNKTYRDDSKISRLEREVRSLESDIRDLDSRSSSLSSLALRVALDTDISGISTWFLDLSYVDRVALERYSSEHADNKKEINNNNNAISQKESQYHNNIGSARNSYSNSVQNEEEARTNHSNAQGKVNQLSSELENIKANPLPDNDPKVVPFATNHKKALDHQNATIGENAPLTKEKNSSQSVVDDINSRYQTDKKDFESKMSNSANSANGKAQQLINETRSKL